MTTPAASSRCVVAELQRDSAGKPRAFALSYERERIVLDPVTSWAKADTFKWVTRGILEQPQSFHVHPDGTVELNGEKISPQDAEGTAKLEREINKHHELAPTTRTVGAFGPRKSTAQAHPTDRVVFHVKLDHFGHLQIECFAGEERTGTGLRGLPSLMQNGLMLKPAQFHIDPMQRHVEIDEVRFECTEDGARQLEAALNARYASKLKDPGEIPVEIRENPASPSGFDIRFVTLHAGARFEIKGHLDQEKLDILQDQSKCNLLKPGILFRLVPPFLLVRRRRPDGGEERLPEIPDLPYLRATVVELQQFINHPLVRRTAAAGPAIVANATEEAPEVVAFRVRRNPQNKLVLWIESLSRSGTAVGGWALTHHNLAELQHAGTFLPHLDVTLSLDNRTLSVLDTQTGQERHLVVDATSLDDDLARLGEILTAALRPPAPRPITTPSKALTSPSSPPVEPALHEPTSSGGARLLPSLPNQDLDQARQEPRPTGFMATEQVRKEQDASPEPPLTPALSHRTGEGAPADARAGEGKPGQSTGDEQFHQEPTPPKAATESKPSSPAAVALPPPNTAREAEAPQVFGFPATDPAETIAYVFRALVVRARLPLQDVLLSLPMAFSDRRFEILSFGGQPVESVLELRSEAFAGFYLTHLHADHVLLVYANRGRHVEFGPQRCEVQPAVAAEPDEFKGPGLLGLAQDPEANFVFIVTPGYRAWVTPREKAYLEAAARFLTLAEVANAREQLTLIWPDTWTTAEPRRGCNNPPRIAP